MFVEPGVSYTHGQHTFSFNVPLGYYYNRHANPYTDRPGDATFPRHIFLSSYSLRLGTRSAVPATDQPPAPATPMPVSPPAGAVPQASASVPDSAARTICPTF